MELNYYFDPVIQEDYYCKDKNMLGRHVSFNNINFSELSGFNIAIFGVCEDRNSLNKGCALSPNKIREKLYRLYIPADNLKIADLGNVIKCKTVKETYFAVQEIIIA